MSNFWNERYSHSGYIYGTEPNAFFKNYIDNHHRGKVLLPCEGEGRNAVYAASRGWEVMAFDTSTAGQNKALQLAENKQVKIQYDIIAAENYMSDQKFDLIALIFAHFPQEIRKPFFKKLIENLNSDGVVLLEAFSQSQLGNSSGGPKELELLYTTKELHNAFKTLKIELLEDAQVFLDEGTHHQGRANVMRMIARKQ